MTSIRLPADADLDAETRERLAALPPLNILRMVAHAPPSLGPFAALGGSLLLEAELPPRERELTILRVAHLTGAGYEWHQHEIIGRAVGMTDADLELARRGASTDERDSLLIAATDEITTGVRLSDATLAELLSMLGERQTVELILTVAYYNAVSRFLESARVPLEEGWTLEPERYAAGSD
jgi:4-carboxymuconolactone decarboxylase